MINRTDETNSATDDASSGDDALTWADWQHNHDSLYAHIRSQLAALRPKSNSTSDGSARRAKWNRYCLFRLRCTRCRGVLLEVMDTKPYRALLFRRTEKHPSIVALPAGAPIEARVEQMRVEHERGDKRIRRSAQWSFVVLGGAPNQAAKYQLNCGCRQVTVLESEIFEDLDAGVRGREI